MIQKKVFADHGLIDPLEHVAFQLTGTAASLLGIQGSPTVGSKHQGIVLKLSTIQVIYVRFILHALKNV